VYALAIVWNNKKSFFFEAHDLHIDRAGIRESMKRWSRPHEGTGVS
jgi:hypothetical protein